MNTKFYAPAKYRMSLPGDVTDVDGGLIFPAGVMAGALLRRNLSKTYPHLQSRLLDPQLYLAALPASSCRKACINLMSYGWFAADEIPSYESTEQTQADWKEEIARTIIKKWPAAAPKGAKNITLAVERCVTFQRNLKCEAIILPSPLTTELASDYSVELSWLDCGLEVANALASGLNVYATVAISDTALRSLEPEKNDLITVILDQLTARNLSGVYIVIEQANENGYYCTHPNTVGALLRLVHELKQGGVQRIVLAPTGIAGFLATSVGADVWSAGWYRGERRIKLSDYSDQMGMAVPTYYVHSLASEIHLDQDLDTIVADGHLKLVIDSTPASVDLIRALRAGASVASVPEWRYAKSNVTAACEHFLYAAIRETETMAACADDDEARLAALKWLQTAAKSATELFTVGGLNPRTELNHQSAWLQAYKRFLKDV